MPNQPDVVHDVTAAGRGQQAGTCRQDWLQVAVVEGDATHAVVQATGRLSLSTLDRLTDALSDQLARGRRHVRLDVSGLADATPTALRALVRVHRQFIDAHGLLVLDAGPTLRWRLTAAGVDRALFVTPAPTRTVVPVTNPERHR